MCLSEHEICVSYKYAANKVEQLIVINELTLLPKSKIAEILEKNGIKCVYQKKIKNGKKGEKKGYIEFKFDTDKAMQLYEKGYVDKKIALELGISKASVINWRKCKKLISNGQKKKEISKSQIPELLKLGYTIQKIAQILGISESTIYNFKKKHNIKPKKLSRTVCRP